MNKTDIKKDINKLLKEDKSCIIISDDFVIRNGTDSDLLIFCLIGLLNIVKDNCNNKREMKKDVKYFMKLALKYCDDIKFSENKEELD